MLSTIREFFHTLIHHRAIIQRQHEELMKPMELRFEEIKATPGGFEMIISSPFFKDITRWLVDTFKSVDGATNYLTISLMDPIDNEPYDVTVQRTNGESRESLLQKENQKLKGEVVALRARVALYNSSYGKSGEVNIEDTMPTLRKENENLRSVIEEMEQKASEKSVGGWNIEDVHRSANNHNLVLTQWEAQSILDDLEETFDASSGMSWDDIEAAVLSSDYGRDITPDERQKFDQTSEVIINEAEDE